MINDNSYFEPRFNSSDDHFDNLFGIKINIGGKKNKKEKKAKKERKKVSFNEILAGASGVLSTAQQGVGIYKSIKDSSGEPSTVSTADGFAVVNPAANAAAKNNNTTYIIIGVVAFIIICAVAFFVIKNKKS